MNEKLKSVKLGAPDRIEINNCPTLESLDVQITERLNTIIVKGDIGTKNPFERAAELLRQQEVEANKESDLDVELSIPTDAILNGGDTKVEILKSRLPKEYQEVEYLESTGTQYIDTGATFSADMEFNCKWADVFENGVKKTVSSENKGYGIGNSGASYIAGGGRISGNKIALWINNSNRTSSLASSDSTGVYIDNISIDSQLSLRARMTDIQGNSYLDYQYTMQSLPTTSLFLFKSSWTGYAMPAVKRIYSVIFSTGGKETINLVPCYRKTDHKPGMYELLSGTFFTNQGSGEFEIGEDVIDEGTLPRNYYWQLTNINPESTAIPTIDQRGNITMEDGKWAEFDVKVKRYADASWFKKHFQLGLKFRLPEYIDIITEYPKVINSLADTGERNWLVSDGTAYIETGIFFGPENYQDFFYEQVMIIPSYQAGVSYYANGVGGTNPYMFLGLRGNSASSFAYQVAMINRELSLSNTYLLIGEPLTYIVDVKNKENRLEFKGRTIMKLNSESNFSAPQRSAEMNLFRYKHSNNGTSSVPFIGKINYVKYLYNGETHLLIPFVRNEKAGMLDLFDKSFHSSPVGLLTVETI